MYVTLNEAENANADDRTVPLPEGSLPPLLFFDQHTLQVSLGCG